MESSQLWDLVLGAIVSVDVAVLLYIFKKIIDMDVRLSKIEVSVESWLVKSVNDIKTDVAKLVQLVHDLAIELAEVKR
jgi:hypothetical protein